MKNSIFVLSFIFTLISCGVLKSGKNEYGEVKVSSQGSVSIGELAQKMDKTKDPFVCTLKAPISAVCQNAGCWIQVTKPDGLQLTIRFKNHFTIPVDTPIGTEAYIHGFAYWDTVSVKTLRHYAEDAGKTMEEINKINTPEYKLNFESDGIQLLLKK